MQPAYAAGYTREGIMNGIVALVAGSALILGFFGIVLWGAYLAAKRSTIAYQENLVAGLNIPDGQKVVFPSSLFFLLFFITSYAFCIFIAVVIVLLSLVSSDHLPTFFALSADYLTYWFFPFIVFMTSLLFIIHPLRKLKISQHQNAFSFIRFFLVIGFCCIIFAGLSAGFDTIASNADPHDGGCDICGGLTYFEHTVNGIRVNEFCTVHAYVFYIFHPFIIIDNSSGGIPFEILVPLTYSAYHWAYGLGLAVIAGKRYGWSIHMDPVPEHQDIAMRYECTACHTSFSRPLKECSQCGGPVIGIKKLCSVENLHDEKL